MYNNSLSQKMSKINFKSNMIPDTFVSEQEIIKKIKTMPRETLEERQAFIKYCKSIKLTPQISAAINERLANLDKEAGAICKEVIDKVINPSKKLIEGYKELVESGVRLREKDILYIKKMTLESILPENIRNEAKSLLERILRK